MRLQHDLLGGDLRVDVGDSGGPHRPALVDPVGEVQAEGDHGREVDEARPGVTGGLERQARAAHVDLPEAGLVARHAHERRGVDEHVAALGRSLPGTWLRDVAGNHAAARILDAVHAHDLGAARPPVLGEGAADEAARARDADLRHGREG